MKLKIAFLQLQPNANIEDNMKKGVKACREAKEKGADIVLFPEMWSTGYVFPHDKEWLEQNAASLDSAYVKQFSALAAELDMAIAVTLLEKNEPKPRNTVCLFDGNQQTLSIARPRIRESDRDCNLQLSCIAPRLQWTFHTV